MFTVHSQLTQHCFLCTLVCSSGMKAFLKFPRESERDIKNRESLEWCIDSLTFSSLFTFFCICLENGGNLLYVFYPLNFLKSTHGGGENVHAFFQFCYYCVLVFVLCCILKSCFFTLRT